MKWSVNSASVLFLSVVLASGCQTKTDATLVTSSTDKGTELTKENADTNNEKVEESAPSASSEDAAEQPTTVKAETAEIEPVKTEPEPPGATGFDKYVPPKPGTVFTFRNNWASLPPVITYEVDGVVEIGGGSYLKMVAISGMKEKVSAYYDTENFSLKGYRDAKNKAMLTYKPTDQRYKFPMKPGDRWTTAWRSYDHREEKQYKGGGIVHAIKKETLKLPSGVFETMKVRLPAARELPKGMVHHVWFAPKLGITVKEQIGNGNMNWTQVLESVKIPEISG